MKIIVILNDIRSSENVGSIFRTADAAGVSKIILAGYTPSPIDRFGRENRGLAKAALGAEKFVEWERIDDLDMAIRSLQNCSASVPSEERRRQREKISSKKFSCKASRSNFAIIAIEQDKKAIDYKEIRIDKTKNVALVFGNEVDGLSKEDLKLCDLIAQIPMHGRKESLNVAVSAGIILYSLITDGIND